MNVLRQLYGYLGVGVLLTVFWLSIPVALVVVVSGVGDKWGAVQWLLLFLATAAVTALSIFLHHARQERSSEAARESQRQEERRVAAIPPAVRLETARSDLELAKEARSQVGAAHRHLRSQYEFCESMSYQEADRHLREAREWIDELVEDLQSQARGGDSAESSPQVAAQFLRATLQQSAGEPEPSPESVEAAIESARTALSEVTIVDLFALNAADDALVSAKSWASTALAVE